MVKKVDYSNDSMVENYTLQGVVSVKNINQDEFIEFLKKFNKKNVRKEITLGLDNLFLEIAQKEKLSLRPIFLGVTSYDIINLYEDIDEFFTFIKEFKATNLGSISYYSIHKKKMLFPLLKSLFMQPFRKEVIFLK